jgi:hypothetical protein
MAVQTLKRDGVSLVPIVDAPEALKLARDVASAMLMLSRKDLDVVPTGGPGPGAAVECRC